MKKIALILLLMTTYIGLATAQTQVTGGTSQTLTAVHTHGDSFSWTIVGNVSLETVSGLGNGNAVTFTWPTVTDIYTITVITTDINGCKSEPFTQQVNVMGTPTVEFADAGDILGVCSAATSIVDNGSSDVIIAYTGAEPWVLTYSVVDDTDTPVTGFDNIVVPNLNGDYTINVPHAFVNEDVGTKNWKVIINGAQSADGVDVNAADNDRNIVVYPKPVITNLTLN